VFRTPFDPRTELRLANFLEFKATALEAFESGDIHAATEYILKNHAMYVRPRGTIVSPTDLAADLGLEPLSDKEASLARKHPARYHHPYGVPRPPINMDAMTTTP
jgi:hypothetical protein